MTFRSRRSGQSDTARRFRPLEGDNVTAVRTTGAYQTYTCGVVRFFGPSQAVETGPTISRGFDQTGRTAVLSVAALRAVVHVGQMRFITASKTLLI